MNISKKPPLSTAGRLHDGAAYVWGQLLMSHLLQQLHGAQPLHLQSSETIALVSHGLPAQSKPNEVEAIAIQRSTSYGSSSRITRPSVALMIFELSALVDKVFENPALEEWHKLRSATKRHFFWLKVVHSYKPGLEGFTRYVIGSNGINHTICTLELLLRHRVSKHRLTITNLEPD